MIGFPGWYLVFLDSKSCHKRFAMDNAVFCGNPQEKTGKEVMDMATRQLKKELLALLARPELPGILGEIAKLPALPVINVLFSGICHVNEVLRWHAVSCMGVTVARLAGEDMEQSRVVMRRLLWSLNDESGGIGWGAPEAMAEIMVHHRGLAEEYLHMLTSYLCEDGEELFQDGNYLEHIGLQRGLLWGIARLAGNRRDMLRKKKVAEELPAYLHSADLPVRALAARALGLLGQDYGTDLIRFLCAEEATIRLYEDGIIQVVTVGNLAQLALHQITEGDKESL